MPSSTLEPVTIAVDDGIAFPACWKRRREARACYVLAHGAGAGMTHPFMAAVAAELAAREIATLRYQFPYMERGSKRPDPPKLAHAAVRAAVAEAARRLPKLPLIAGGKSFGGRMTSQAQAAAPLPGVRGLAFLGFPLHPASRRPAIAASICSTCKCRCCSCKERATRSRCSISSNRSARSSAHARACGCSRAPITRSMCRRKAAAPMPRSWRKCWIRWQPGRRRWPAADPEVWLIAVPVELAARGGGNKARTFSQILSFLSTSRTNRRENRWFAAIVRTEFVMAPRPYWKGYLKLSLVACPVAVFTATTSSERVSFRQINKQTGNRLRQQLVDDVTREPVEAADKIRGYEVDKNVYVQVEDEEIEALQVESTHTIDIDSFVPRDADRRALSRKPLLYRAERSGRPRSLRGHPRGDERQGHGRARPDRSRQARARHRAATVGKGPARHDAALRLRGAQRRRIFRRDSRHQNPEGDAPARRAYPREQGW